MAKQNNARVYALLCSDGNTRETPGANAAANRFGTALDNRFARCKAENIATAPTASATTVAVKNHGCANPNWYPSKVKRHGVMGSPAARST
jgi:hypothetical protein